MTKEIDRSSPQDPQEPQDQSKRDFLRMALISTATTAVEATIRPIGASIDLLARNGFLGEGHPLQRVATLERLVRMIEFDPHNEEKRETLVSWFKFNAAELYGPIVREPFAIGQGEPIASKFSRHFLYGFGSPYNLMAEYAKSWQEFYQKIGTEKILTAEDPSPDGAPVIRNPVDAVRLHTERTLTRVLYHQLFPQTPAIDYSIVLTPKNILSVKAVTGAYDQVPGRENQDLWRALHYWTITISGNPVIHGPFSPVQRLSVYGKELPDFYKITLINPLFELYDRYDFGDVRKIHTKTIGDGLKDVLQFIKFNEGKRIGTLIGQEKLADLYNTVLEIGHADGLRLVKYGFAHDFDVVGSMRFNHPLVFYASDEVIRSTFPE